MVADIRTLSVCYVEDCALYPALDSTTTLCRVFTKCYVAHLYPPRTAIALRLPSDNGRLSAKLKQTSRRFCSRIQLLLTELVQIRRISTCWPGWSERRPSEPSLALNAAVCSARKCRSQFTLLRSSQKVKLSARSHRRCRFTAWRSPVMSTKQWRRCACRTMNGGVCCCARYLKTINSHAAQRGEQNVESPTSRLLLPAKISPALKLNMVILAGDMDAAVDRRCD